ncbi:Hypothetical protein Minf_0622 [Methylacidiphilum infernorum V4]|uniref:Uncharacterized protein n=2 Tax=Candidatus Methylacidiphilum infernorum TaxID=511746 RepID=B3E016_METI4|nr:Hypothetical protein Minf_0622 [Methylacidiphilum infernorum V4]
MRDEEGRAKSLGDEEKEAAMRIRTKKKVFMEEKKIFSIEWKPGKDEQPIDLENKKEKPYLVFSHP